MSFERLRTTLSTVLVGALTLVGTSAVAQTPAAGRETSAASVARYGLAQNMPVDPEATVGTLPNGLRYYVRANGRPAHRAELRLVVKAGSVLEDEDQRGLAHFVEHMEFEGTRHFPGQGIVDFLSALGLSIGADANAETSFDDTQYTLRIPTDVPGVLDRALLVLEDWAQAAVFDQGGIDRERGIVLSEWRLHLGASERTADKIRSVQLQGSRYADRPPIGNPDVIEHAQREQLVRFYHDWYRPDLMAVIVVGDVNRDNVAALIKAHFSPLTSPSPERPRPAYDVPEKPGTRYTVATDKEATTTSVALTDLRPARNQATVGGYRDIMRDQLFGSMLGARLDELAAGTNPPYLRAAAERSLFETPRTRDEAVLEALVSNDGVTRGLDALVSELQRVVRYGFTATELARAKQARQAGYERAVTESPDRESASRADEYTRNFLEGEALPTIWQELAFNRRFLPEITLAEMNRLASDWFPEANRLVIVSGPDTAATVLPDETALAAAVKAAAAKRLDAYADNAGAQSLIDTPPKPGTIVRSILHPESGITEWTLSNGATVLLKPTMLRQDQILFRAIAPGGTSLASDDDFFSARAADEIVPAGGVGRFSSITLDRMLAGKALAVRPFIDELNEGMEGGSTPQDLEAAFQLLYLRFTQPRADPTAFAAMAGQARALVANQMASPDFVFNQSLELALNGNSQRRQPETAASVDRWDLDKAMAFYKARFADAGNFTFVFVGSFTVDALKPLVTTYIASLPATQTHETWRDVGVMRQTGVIEKTIEKGIAPKSQVAIIFSGPFEYTEEQTLALQTMTLVLQSRLLDTIRQELGGTYSITAVPTTEKFPRPQYTVRIEWTCDPAQTKALVQRVFQEITFVRDHMLSPGQMRLVREGLLRDFERNSQDNSYLLNEITRRYAERAAPESTAIDVMPTRIAALTGEALEQAARTYLNLSNYIQVTLMPETK